MRLYLPLLMIVIMAVPNKAKSACKVENDLKKVMVKVMEAEQQSRLLENMIREGLVTKDILSILTKQKKSMKTNAEVSSESGEVLMKSKLKDSKKYEHSLRLESKMLGK